MDEAHIALGRLLALVGDLDLYGPPQYQFLINRMRVIRLDYLDYLASSAHKALPQYSQGAEREGASTGKTGASNSEGEL